jgi:adenine-specific DNA-methyltransferase
MIEAAAALPEPHTFEEPQEFRSPDRRVVATIHGLHDAIDQLKRLSQPFLNWAGRAERLSFDVLTLPLFVHERLSTKAIIETLQSHRKRKRSAQLNMFELFGDPQRPVIDQVLKAYEYRDKWVNRMILGDSLVVMNSLLHYEGLGGQVQTIYIDPPYGVKFGSNFQPFVRRRDVTHNDDADMTREPEMVKAYRDTWELGLHSYLTYLRDRLLLGRDLLHSSGSIFVQISDENLHHVRELLDEIFTPDNFVSLIAVIKTTGVESKYLTSTSDYLIWYAKNKNELKYRPIFSRRLSDGAGAERYDHVELPDGTRRPMTAGERASPASLPAGARRFRLDNLIASEFRPDTTVRYVFEGKTFHPGKSNHWKTSVAGLDRLAGLRRLMATQGNTLNYLRFIDDFPARPIGNVWHDISGSIQSRSDPKIYVVQTSTSVIQRCVLMTTDPGDLVLDPTCGSGTTAYVAEQWGRRWITVDTSRVPLALARQRLLTATFPYFQLKDENRGPAAGFVYTRRQNRRGEEVGGIISRTTLGMLANNEPADEVILVDSPEEDAKITRVAGPFCVEAMIPTPVEWEGDGRDDSAVDGDAHGSFLDRMLEALRRSPVLQLGSGKSVTLHNVRLPAKSLALSAEATVDVSAGGDPISLAEAVTAADERNRGGLPFSQKPVVLVLVQRTAP